MGTLVICMISDVLSDRKQDAAAVHTAHSSVHTGSSFAELSTSRSSALILWKSPGNTVAGRGSSLKRSSALATRDSVTSTDCDQNLKRQ